MVSIFFRSSRDRTDMHGEGDKMKVVDGGLREKGSSWDCWGARESQSGPWTRASG